MAKPGTDGDGTMVEKQTGKKGKDKISSFTKTPKLDRGELLEREMKQKSSMKRKLAFTLSPQRNEERYSDTDSDPGHSSETWGESFSPPCTIYTDKDGPEKKKVKKETGSKKSTPMNILFGYPLSERKQMALLMQMTARDNSPESTPSHTSQVTPVQKKISSSATSRQKDKINKRNERGETALHMAAIRGDVKQVKELISLGADANVKDFAGWTPLHEACNLGHYEVAKVLIATGAEVNTQGLDDDTPLHDASSSGHKDIVRLLLKHGGSPFQANERGERPVDVADSKEMEELLKGEGQLSNLDDSSSDSEGHTSADDNMECLGPEKDNKQAHATNTSASTAGMDEYEFKDEEDEDLTNALKDRPLLKREPRQREKDGVERNHFVDNLERSESPRNCKSKNKKISSSSVSSSDETSPERKSSSTCPLSTEVQKADVRTKKLNSTVEQTGKTYIRRNLTQNKEIQDAKEDRKENCKGLLPSTTEPGLETPGKSREEDCFKMSFSPKDEDSVHLFPLSTIKSPKHNHSDTQSGPPKNFKWCTSSGDSPSQVDSEKHNHHVEPYISSESSCSKGLKHKEKSKYHHKDLNCDEEGQNFDNCEDALQKTDKEGKVIKKHKLKHQEKDNSKKNDIEKEKNRKDGSNEKDTNQKENETEWDKHRQRDTRKDGHRHIEFDRAFWKENFFKSDENEELLSHKNEVPESGSLQKGTDVPLVKEERISKEKHAHSKDKKQKEEREKDLKKEKEELQSREEKGKEVKIAEEKTDCHTSNRGPVDCSVKEEVVDNHISENKLQGQTEKGVREKTEKRLPGRERESEKTDKKHSDRERKLKNEHLGDKTELSNSTDKLKEREKITAGCSSSPLEKNQKESEKSKATSLTKMPEDKKIKEKMDGKNEKEKQEKVRCPRENRDKEKSNTDKKGKTSEKVSAVDQGKCDRVKEKDKDNEKKKKDKIKDITSSNFNLKMLLTEKRMSVCENSKTYPDKTKQKEDVLKPLEKDKRTRDKNGDRHRDGQKDKSQQTKTSKIKMNEAEADGTKSKSSPALKDARPKEKRLVNDDLMQTSFERMLSLKDQEIEQWHRKHKEKIKQKERERMKHQPVAELNKLKSRDRVKNSPVEPCLSKDHFRSKSSDVSEAHSQEKVLTETTSARSVSLDTRSIVDVGKAESDRSGIMCRSGSTISVASSEDSYQTAVLTPRPLAEFDSGLVQEGLDSQPCTINSSTAVHENECDGFPDAIPQRRTSLSNKQETPGSTADEDNKPISTDGRLHELSWSGAFSAKGHSEDSLPESNTESHRNQGTGLLQPSHSNCSIGTPADAGNEVTHLSPHILPDVSPVSEPGSRELSLKDSDGSNGEHSSMSQADTSLQPTTETKDSSLADLVFEGDALCPQGEDSRMKTSVEKSTSELIIVLAKESLAVDKSPLSEDSSNGKVSDCSGEHHDVCTDCTITVQRAERDSAQKEKPSLLEDILCCVRPLEDSTGLCSTSFNTKTHGMIRNFENSSLNVPRDVQENMETDCVVPQDTKQRLTHESMGACKLQSDSNEFTDLMLSDVMESCQGAKHQPQENTLHEAQNSKERSGSLETAENTSLPVETRPEACTINEVKAETRENVMAFVAIPDKKFQQLQQDASNSSPSSLQGDFPTELSSIPSGSSSPHPGEGDSDSCGAISKTRLSEDDDIQLPHPRKRKMHRTPQSVHAGPTALYPKEKTQQSLAAIVDSLKLEEIEPYQTERANPYYEFLHIRRKIEEKRKVLCSVIPQAPQYYDEYVTFNGSYLLDGNPLGKLCIPTITPPPSLPEPLKEMFKQQEVVRMKLRLQHSIEREKLILSNEQEVLRVHYRAARTLANQALPFSACTVLLDAEVYNMPQDVQGDDCKASVRDRFNARQFMSWLQDVDDKFDKLKTCLLMRQQHEAAALNAVQRLEWQLKLQELDPAAYKAISIFQIPEFYIPLVDVSDDFELAPI